MLRVCCYKGCGVVYGEKDPLSDKKITHGLCQEHLKITLKEIKDSRRLGSREKDTGLAKHTDP
jgi:hypothetical protein